MTRARRPGPGAAGVAVVAGLVVVAAVVIMAGLAGVALPVLGPDDDGPDPEAEQAALSHVERRAGRSGATVSTSRGWADCAVVTVALDGDVVTAAVHRPAGAWVVGHSSDDGSGWFDGDDVSRRAHCLAVARDGGAGL